MKINNSLSFYLCLTLISISYLLLIIINQKQFDFSFNYNKLSNIYLHSQIIQGSNATITMYDPQLYQYAGYSYLTKGGLDEINIEHPPLGKYLYGLSAIIFKSPLIFQLISGYLLLILTFLLSYQFTSKIYLSLIPTVLLLTDGLFLSQISQTELDLPLTFLILFFLYFNLNKQKQIYSDYLINGILLGLIAAIKFPSTAFLLALTYIIWLIINKNKNALFKTGISLSLVIITFTAMYLPLIINKGFPVFIQTQVNAAHIQLSHLPNYPPFAAVRVIFTNQWRIWFDSQNLYQKVGVWNIFWPISTIIFILTLFFIKKIPSKMYLSYGFAWVYFIFINLRLFFPRYLMEILPLFYIYKIWLLMIIYKKLKVRLNK